MFHSHSSPIPPFAIFPPFRLQIPPWGAKWLTLRNTGLNHVLAKQLISLNAERLAGSRVARTNFKAIGF